MTSMNDSNKAPTVRGTLPQATRTILVGVGSAHKPPFTTQNGDTKSDGPGLLGGPTTLCHRRKAGARGHHGRLASGVVAVAAQLTPGISHLGPRAGPWKSVCLKQGIGDDCNSGKTGSNNTIIQMVVKTTVILAKTEVSSTNLTTLS